MADEEHQHRPLPDAAAEKSVAQVRDVRARDVRFRWERQLVQPVLRVAAAEPCTQDAAQSAERSYAARAAAAARQSAAQADAALTPESALLSRP
jgi:hypothetical protein